MDKQEIIRRQAVLKKLSIPKLAKFTRSGVQNRDQFDVLVNEIFKNNDIASISGSPSLSLEHCKYYCIGFNDFYPIYYG